MHDCAEHGKVLTPDGLSLFFRRAMPGNPKAVVVILHSVAEHCGRYAHVGEALNGKGYGVYRFDSRGHGLSGGERAYAESFHAFLDDADLIVERVRAEHPGLPIFLLGHGLGAFVAMGHTAKYPGKTQGHITSGAAVRPMPAFESLCCAGYRAQGRERVTHMLEDVICRRKDVTDAFRRDPLALRRITRQLAGTVWKDGIDWLEQLVKKIEAPLLILHGGDDLVVPPEASRWLHDSVASSDKKLKFYPGLYHEILNDDGHDEVMTDIVDWLNQRT